MVGMFLMSWKRAIICFRWFFLPYALACICVEEGECRLALGILIMKWTYSLEESG